MKNLGDKIKIYTPLEIERAAEDLVSSIPTLMGRPPPILAELILDKIDGVVAFDSIDLVEAGLKAEAMVLSRKGLPRDLTVIVDKRLLDHRDDSRYNITIAEEIGHIELHRSVMLDIREHDDFRALQAHPNWFIAERDAKAFGRVLLMPRHHIELAASEIYKELVSSQGFGDPIQLLDVLIAKLAMRFHLPRVDCVKRVDSYTGDLVKRFHRSIAACNESLLGSRDYLVLASRRQQKELTHEQLFGEPSAEQ